MNPNFYIDSNIGLTCYLTSDDQINIELQTQVGLANKLYLSISKIEFERQASLLAKAYEEYVSSNSYKCLVRLARTGSSAFKVLAENAVNNNARKHWRKIFSEAEISDFSHVIYVISQKNVTFPFGLLYLGKKGDINESNRSNIAKYFLGARSVIVNGFVGENVQLENTGNIVCKEDEHVIIHCVRNSLSGVEGERSVLEGKKLYKRMEVTTPAAFYKTWNETLDKTCIVHFSAEHGYNEDSKRFEIYLDNLSDPITTSDLYESLDHAEERPLVFLNCCSTGFFSSNMGESFVLAFCKYSWGVIATLVKIDSIKASKFAKGTYERLFLGDRISEAIVLTKMKMLENGDATGLCYEIWNINHKTKLSEVANV